MRENLLFVPLLLQVILTLYAYVMLSLAKSKAAKAGLVNEARRGLHDDAWPDNVLQINNNIRNQFELPVLFYVLVIVLWTLDSAGPLVQAAAWLFVVSRAVHLYIHTGTNFVPFRRRVFTFGFFMVAVLAGALVQALLQG